MVTNRRLVETSPDFYPTPEWATELLLMHEKFKGTIWEPACGEGDMAEVISSAGYDVIASDLYDRGYGTSIDFLKQTEISKIDNIITNPPFTLAEDFFEAAYKITTRKICLLLRTAFVESQRRYEKIFKKTPPVRIWTFSERLSMYPKNYVVQAGGTTSYSWFVFDKQDKSGKTEMKWFPPGHKPKGKLK